MGSTFRLPVAVRSAIAREVVDGGARAGIAVLATVPRGGTPLPARRPARARGHRARRRRRRAVAETRRDSADASLTIPMRPPVESLNVAIAAALILYEASRQRGAPR